jgi:CDGSH-type Zn-finger protein
VSAGGRDAGAGARITPYRDGPLLVRGTFTLTDQDGEDIEFHGQTIALCRCGRSRQKPFCDGMHKAVDWRAPSEAQHPHAVEPRFAHRHGSTTG